MTLGTRGKRTYSTAIACALLAALCVRSATGAALGDDAKKPYYTEPPLYSFRPTPDQEEIIFGNVGVSGLLINFYKGVVATVDKTLPNTPADGKFKSGQIITGVNGVSFEGKNPYVILGSALTKAEATDGALVFDVKDNEQAPVKQVKIVIPVLGSYGSTWPLNSEKSKRIIKAAATFYSTDKQFKHDYYEATGEDGPIGAALACLFLLSTGDDQYLPCVKRYFAQFPTDVRKIGNHTWNNGYNGIACAEYYLRTGDEAVLPLIQYYCDDAAARQAFGCGWGHWGFGISPSYVAGGTMNAAGTQLLTTMLLGKECGVKVDEAALLGTLRFSYHFAGHGSIPYGDHRAEGGLGSNGKDGMAAAAMQIAAATQGDPTIYQRAKMSFAMAMILSYPCMTTGHGDDGRGDAIWRGITSSYIRDVKPDMYHSIMGNLAWYYDLCRRPSGTFGVSACPGFDDPGSGAAIALTYTAPLKTLRITGAPPSKHSKKFTVPARLWGNETDLAFLSIEKNPKFASMGKTDLIEVPFYTFGSAYGKPTAAPKDVPKNEIIKNVYHDAYVVRTYAAKALKKIGAYDDLATMLDDPDPRGRRAAIDGMVDYNFWFWMGREPISQNDLSPKMIASLKRMLSDTNEAVWVVDGALTLMSLAPAATIAENAPLIMPWLKHEDWWLRQSAFMALLALRTDPAHFEKVLPALVDTMTKEYHTQPREAFLGALEPLLNAKASPVGKDLLAGMLKAVETTEIKPDRGPYPQSLEGGYNVKITAQACLRQAPETGLQTAQLVRKRIPSMAAGDVMGLVDSLIATTNSLKPAEREELVSILYTDFRKELMKRLKTDAGVLDKIIDVLRLKHPDVAWHVMGTPLPADRTWRFMSFNPQEKDVMHPREKKRFRDVTLPARMENWFAPEFKDAAWKSGKAPIGVGVSMDSRGQVITNQSDWGSGEFLLMRTTFTLAVASYDYIRLRLMTRQGCHVYLNNHIIHTYEWWNDRPGYLPVMLGSDETKYLKKGVNTLAVYSNIEFKKGQTFGLADVFLEGLNEKDLTKHDQTDSVVLHK